MRKSEFWIFVDLLNEEVDKRFPNTIRISVKSSDYNRDCVIELRDGVHRMRYNPYEMYMNLNGNYEDSILKLCDDWEKELNK